MARAGAVCGSAGSKGNRNSFFKKRPGPRGDFVHRGSPPDHYRPERPTRRRSRLDPLKGARQIKLGILLVGIGRVSLGYWPDLASGCCRRILPRWVSRRFRDNDAFTRPWCQHRPILLLQVESLRFAYPCRSTPNVAFVEIDLFGPGKTMH